MYGDWKYLTMSNAKAASSFKEAFLSKVVSLAWNPFLYLCTFLALILTTYSVFQSFSECHEKAVQFYTVLCPFFAFNPSSGKHAICIGNSVMYNRTGGKITFEGPQDEVARVLYTHLNADIFVDLMKFITGLLVFLLLWYSFGTHWFLLVLLFLFNMYFVRFFKRKSLLYNGKKADITDPCGLEDMDKYAMNVIVDHQKNTVNLLWELADVAMSEVLVMVR